MKLYPDNQDYKLYYAQSLYKVRHSCTLRRCCCLHTYANTAWGMRMAGLWSISMAWRLIPPFMQAGSYLEASKASGRVEGHQKAVTTLLVANSYEQDDLVGERAPAYAHGCTHNHYVHISLHGICNISARPPSRRPPAIVPLSYHTTTSHRVSAPAGQVPPGGPRHHREHRVSGIPYMHFMQSWIHFCACSRLYGGMAGQVPQEDPDAMGCTETSLQYTHPCNHWH